MARRLRALVQDGQLTLATVLACCEQRTGGTGEIVSASAGGDVDGDDRRASYPEWTRDVGRLVGAIELTGVGRGEPVAVLASNGRLHFDLLFAVPCSGRVLQSLNVRYTPSQLAGILDRFETAVLIAERPHLELAHACAQRAGSVRRLVVAGGLGDETPGGRYEAIALEEIASGAGATTEPPREADPACVAYTSGTSGRPKGVVFSHRALVLQAGATLARQGAGLSESDSVLHAPPFFHAGGWGLPYGGALCGASHLLPGADASPRNLCELIESERPTVMGAVPTVWGRLLAHAAAEGVPLDSLRAPLCAGAALTPNLAAAFASHGLAPIHAWGMTETGTMALYAHPDGTETGFPQGSPLPGIRVRLVDESGAEVPWDGASRGELQVRGPWIASGYDPGESGERDEIAEGWLATGDLATISPGGSVSIVDRRKDMIKSGGEWIAPAVLERELISVPGIEEAAVIAAEHPDWGERPIACLVPAPGVTPGRDELIAALRRQVPAWWVPDELIFLDALPSTPAGKVDKRVLRRRFGARLVDSRETRGAGSGRP